mmetsp:Transcript_72490/g.169841  ORF Transcript_72490/g.169841 Transcript_72490/m.169841 type:complete len:512 (+) Transcript_72490:28-1563(+)
MEAMEAQGQHSRPQKWVMGLGLLSSSTCGFLGFPCASGGWEHAFRATCLGYFLCSLVSLLLKPGGTCRIVCRLGLLINSLSAWLVSALWCVGFGEWFILFLLEGLFQFFGVLVLVETHFQSHLLFTWSGCIVGYMYRAEVADHTFDPMSARLWAAAIVTTVLALVTGMWYSNHRSIEFIKKRFKAISDILSMSEEQLDSTPPTSRLRTASELTSTTPNPSPSISVSGTTTSDTETWIPGLSLSRAVGQGSFGKVYLGVHKDKEVAVKIIMWDPKSRVNPVKEAELCLKLIHPKLVQAYDFFIRDVAMANSSREMWLLQEWCNGGTLAAFCNEERMDDQGLRQVKSMMYDVAEGTSHLHACDVIHGDLTSNNVLLKTRSNPGPEEMSFVCKICDFGLARVLEEGINTILTSQLGTVSHMPPELLQLENKALSRKADIYAIGVLLYQAVLGTFPYKGMMVPQIVLWVARGNQLSLPAAAPESVKAVFNRCIARNPKQRPSAAELTKQFAELAW